MCEAISQQSSDVDVTTTTPRNIAKKLMGIPAFFLDLQGTSKTSTSARMPHHSNQPHQK